MIGILALVVIVLIAIWVFSGLTNILFAVVAWAIAGAIASRLMGGDGSGLLGNILLGIIGGFVGSFLLGLFGINDDVASVWIIGNILVGIVGAAALIFIVRTVSGNKAFGR